MTQQRESGKYIREALTSITAPVVYGDPSMGEAYLDATHGSSSAIVEDRREILVRDARPIVGDLSLDREGFTLVEHAAQTPIDEDFLTLNAVRQDDSPTVNQLYVAEMRRAVEKILNAREVIPQTRRVLVRATARAGRKTPDPIASLVHLDYSEDLAHQVVADSCAALGRAVPAYSRMAIFQTWRMLSDPPQDNTLAICDAGTVLLTDSIIMRARSSGGEEKSVRLCRYNPAQRWYYFKDMRPREFLLFKGFDTAAPKSMTGAHVAIPLPDNGQANARVSLEARFIAFY